MKSVAELASLSMAICAFMSRRKAVIALRARLGKPFEAMNRAAASSGPSPHDRHIAATGAPSRKYGPTHAAAVGHRRQRKADFGDLLLLKSSFGLMEQSRPVPDALARHCLRVL